MGFLDLFESSQSISARPQHDRKIDVIVVYKVDRLTRSLCQRRLCGRDRVELPAILNRALAGESGPDLADITQLVALVLAEVQGRDAGGSFTKPTIGNLVARISSSAKLRCSPIRF